MSGIDWKRETAVSKSVTGTRGRGDAGTGAVGTWELGDVRTWRLGDSGSRGSGDVGTWGRGDSGTRGLIFTICLTFHHISQNPRLLIVTALYPSFKFLICTM